MRPGGEQALANVLHIAELARQYEARGAVSFRGFVEELLQAEETGKQSEAMIYEEGSEGVRIMNVHKVKGLEFPIVILADVACSIAHDPDRYVDAESGLCAVKLAGWIPQDVIDHGQIENARDLAEGIRLTYVAATRARDLLVVPAIGDDPTGSGPPIADPWWIAPLHSALYPSEQKRHRPAQAPMCPQFGIDTVRSRPDNDVANETTVRPGLHAFGGGSTEYGVVWWDPNTLELGKAPSFSIRQRELLETGNEEFTQKCLSDYSAWKNARSELLKAGSTPTIRFQTATDRSKSTIPFSVDVEVIELETEKRPYGPRFGTLVHGILATVSLDAGEDEVAATANLQGRIIGAPTEEVDAATIVVNRALLHPLMQRARRSAEAGQCLRELPLTLTENGLLIEGVADLVFKEDASWVVVDFKTDAEIKGELQRYRKQVSIYAKALSDIHGQICAAYLLEI